MTRLVAATLNILNFEQRWHERMALLLADLTALRPDVLALQEVVFPMQQDRLLGSAGEDEFQTFRGWDEQPETGNSLLVRAALDGSEPARLDLGHGCAANRVVVRGSGHSLVVATTHLHYPPEAGDVRRAQAAALVEWLDETTPTDVQIVMGDFNADPDEDAYAHMASKGFRSASLEANGREPPVTYPTPLLDANPDRPSVAECVDYIWLRGKVRADSCRLAFDRADVNDASLYPSDHFGLVADLELD